MIARHGVTAVLVARLLPFVPFDPISYVAGLARMPLRPFLWVTLAGQIPAGMTYAYLAGQLERPAFAYSWPRARARARARRRTVEHEHEEAYLRAGGFSFLGSSFYAVVARASSVMRPRRLLK